VAVELRVADDVG